LKLWLLDADILIDFLSRDLLDKLVEKHEIYAASSVIDEVRYFKRNIEKIDARFRERYVQTGLIKEVSATAEEASCLLNHFTNDFKFTIHAGEIESLAVLIRQTELIFCTCDAAAIRTLPLLDLTERGISAEKLLRQSGLYKPGLKERHTEEYFKSNISIGREYKIYNLKS
jgi:predicted nucleic acid-binding protein